MTGTWQFSTRDNPKLHLTTAGLPMALAVKAPITGGTIIVSEGADFTLQLDLLQMEAANLAAKFAVGPARKIIRDEGGDVLNFEATAAGVVGPWNLAGTAYAGTLEIPTTVIVTPHAHMETLHIGGTITIDDVEIPLPGLSGVSSITFTLDGKVRLRPS